MKFKKLIIILLSGLSLQIYGMKPEPVEPAKTSTGKPKKSVTFESDQDAAKRTQAEQEQSAAQKQQTVQSDASKASPVQPQSILKTSSDDTTTATTVKLTDGSSELSTGHLDPFEAGKEGAVDYGEVVSGKVIDATNKNTSINANLALEVTPEIITNVSKSIEKNRQLKIEKQQKVQAEKEASIKLAKDLESKARAAKTDVDIKNIVMEDIDLTGKLTPEIIDEAIQASKIWRDPFDGTTYQRWVEVLDRMVSYVKTGKPVPDEFVQKLKDLVDANKGKITSKQDAQAAQAKIEAAKQAKIKDIDDKIAAKDNAINAQTEKISELDTEIRAKYPDIDLYNSQNILPAQWFGDSSEAANVKQEIKHLEDNLSQEQQKLSVLVHEMSDLVQQKSVINGGDIPGLEQDVVDGSASSDMTNEKNKQESLCDTVQACVEKIKDPSDANSLSSILTQVGELAKDPAVMNQFSKEQQDAVNFFVKNGDKIINKFSTLTWTETYNLMKYKDLLPTAKGSQPLNTSVLVTKSGQEGARVQAEQQQTVPPVDLFAPTAAAA